MSYQNDVKVYKGENLTLEDKAKAHLNSEGYNLHHNSSGESGASGNGASMDNHQGSSNSKVDNSGSNSGGTITNTYQYNTTSSKVEKKDDRKAASNKQESSENSGSLESKPERNSD
jgi:hypothetical protein